MAGYCAPTTFLIIYLVYVTDVCRITSTYAWAFGTIATNNNGVRRFSGRYGCLWYASRLDGHIPLPFLGMSSMFRVNIIRKSKNVDDADDDLNDSDSNTDPLDEENVEKNRNNGHDEKKCTPTFDYEAARQKFDSLITKKSEIDGRTDDALRVQRSDNVAFSIEGFLSSCRKRIDSLQQEIVYGDNDSMTTESTGSLLLLDMLPLQPPMSTMERAFRLKEIDLLETIEDGDEVTGELWELWYSEKGPTKKSILGETDALLSDPNSWTLCEERLMKLIDADDNGIYFVEVVNRLATLNFLRGRLNDSYILCRLVLHLKPWHFGALSGIVQVCIGRGDREEARFWAQRRLPTMAAGTSFPPFATEAGGGGAPYNPRRKEWRDRAVADAKKLLVAAEQNTARWLGEADDNYFQNKNQTMQDGLAKKGFKKIAGVNQEDDAWQ